MPETGQQGRLVFDPELLGRAETLLHGRPEQQATSQVGSLQIGAAAFGTVPGGAEAGARLEAFVSRLRTELTAVSADVADLAGRTGEAKRLATDVDGLTQAIADQGSPRGGSGGR